MPIESVRTLWGVLEVVRSAFSPASFSLLVLLFKGWILAGGRHAITDCLLAAGVAGQRDHTAFYRFFSRGTWKPDTLERLVFRALLARLAPDARVDLAIEDTLAHHKGRHIFGLSCHLDAVRSSRKAKVFAFGHVWVVLALVVPLPFARRGFALPILFRLYRSENHCLATGATFRKKTELAREMLDSWLHGWRRPRARPRVASCWRSIATTPTPRCCATYRPRSRSWGRCGRTRPWRSRRASRRCRPRRWRRTRRYRGSG